MLLGGGPFAAGAIAGALAAQLKLPTGAANDPAPEGPADDC
jgi:hypothetical protein